MREWRLEYEARPFTMNQVFGRLNRHDRNALVQEWREAFALLAMEAKVPPLAAIRVFAFPVLRDRRIQDVGACYPAVKSAVDGLVDAGVIPDDDPRYVTMIAMGQPLQEQPRDALRVLIQEDLSG
jgi:crossover junction endodeoxyribonuclease RusA